MRTHILPYFNERPAKISALVLHCSAYDSKDMIEVLEKEELSAHYVVGLNGDVTQLVPEEKRAWHAGISSWREFNNLNHNSIGIEISSMSMGQEPYSERQINSLIELCQGIIARHHIPVRNVVGHSDIAPTRKPDPGAAFPWQKLAGNGIGLWYDLNDAEKVKESNPEILLQKIGYNTENSAAAMCAFCRHFIPQEVAINPDIHDLLQHPYPEGFALDEKYLPILKACCASFSLPEKCYPIRKTNSVRFER